MRNEPTIEDLVKADPWDETIDFSDAYTRAVYRCGAKDALRAVLRELEEVITEDDIDPDGLDLLVKRIRAAVGDE